jgi:hypothetical protein
MLHPVHVMMDGMNPMENAKNVLSDVKNVPSKLTIVTLVPKTESLHQLVDAHLVIMMIIPSLSVHLVLTNVSLVLNQNITVSNVNLVDFKLHLVIVQ